MLFKSKHKFCKRYHSKFSDFRNEDMVNASTVYYDPKELHNTDLIKLCNFFKYITNSENKSQRHFITVDSHKYNTLCKMSSGSESPPVGQAMARRGPLGPGEGTLVLEPVCCLRFDLLL